MTTRIGLQVGNITAIRETQDDARAVSILVAVYEGLGLGPSDAPDEQRLMAVTDWLISVLESRAYEVTLAQRLTEHRETIEAQVRADTQF